jgi:hypothetical protein
MSRKSSLPVRSSTAQSAAGSRRLSLDRARQQVATTKQVGLVLPDVVRTKPVAFRRTARILLPHSSIDGRRGKLGFIEYNGGIHVNKSLLNVVLHDQLPEHNAEKPPIGDPPPTRSRPSRHL